MKVAAIVSAGAGSMQPGQQQLQQWQMSLAQHRSNAASAQLTHDPQLQPMLGGAAMYAYAAKYPSGLTAAPPAHGLGAQQATGGVAATSQPAGGTAGGDLTKARSVAVPLPGDSKTTGGSTSDGTSPTQSSLAVEVSDPPPAAVCAEQLAPASQPSAPPSAATEAAYSALAEFADVQQDDGRPNKCARTQRQSTGRGARSAQTKVDDAKERRKLANREAARRSRLRKEEEEKEFKERLASSEAAANSLRAENAVLRQQLEQMAALLGRLNQDRTALAAQVRSLGGQVRAELEATVVIPPLPTASDMAAIRQLEPQVPPSQELIAGIGPAQVVAGPVGAFSHQQMQRCTGTAVVPLQPAGTLTSGCT